MTYTSADAAYAAIRAKAKAAVRRNGGTVDEWWHRFVFQRFLARVFTADPGGWFLKGGQALLVRNPKGRYTRDIDLYRDNPGNRDEAVAELRLATQLDLGDFMSFEFAGRDDHADENRVARLTFTVVFGSRQHNDVGVDVAINPPPLGTPEKRPLEPALAVGWPHSWPEVTLFPLTDHVADKITAMYELRQGRPSTRWRDLADLVLIASGAHQLDGQLLQITLARQVTYRREQGTVIELPPHFRLPTADWAIKYTELAKTIGELDKYRTYDQALPLITAFLDPVLTGENIGAWDANQQRWQ